MAGDELKTCPFCAEEIKAAAIKCKHCGERIAAGLGVATQGVVTQGIATQGVATRELRSTQAGTFARKARKARVIDNTLVWWLAFAPLIGKGLEVAIATALTSSPSSFWFVTLLLNLSLCYADEQRLKKAGVETSGMGGAWIVPVYLYKRAACLEQRNEYFYFWIACFLASLFLNF